MLHMLHMNLKNVTLAKLQLTIYLIIDSPAAYFDFLIYHFI